MTNNDPTFKRVFSSTWDKLPPAFQKRYLNHSSSNDIVSVEGNMDIFASKIMALLLPIFRLLHVLAPYQGTNIPTKVDFCSEMTADKVYLKRLFYFPNKKPFAFNSCMNVLGENDVIEFMSLGFGWHTNYFFDGRKIIMQHKAYVLKLLNLCIPLPLKFIIGTGYAEEEVINDNVYRVTMTITHPWFGLMYSYAGNFIFTRLPL